MKRLFLCVVLALTVFTGVYAQEAADKDQVVIKFNVLDPTWTPNIYVSKYANFMGKKLIATGSGEVTLDNANQFGYIGFGKNTVQPIKFDSKFLEFDVEKGNPGMFKLGVAGSYIGAIAGGIGLGLLFVSMTEGDTDMLVKSGILAGSGLGVMAGGLVLSYKYKPRLILTSK